MDIHTLHVEHAVLLAVYTLLTVVNARMHKGIRGIHWFSLYNGLLFVGALLIALRGHIPDGLSIAGGNLFIVSGYVVMFLSLAKFFATPLSQLYIQLGLAGVALVTMLQYGWLHPDTTRRLIAFSVVLCGQQAHIALFTARKERRHTHAAASMAVIMGILAVMNLVRLVNVATQGLPPNYLSVRGILVWMVLINTAMQCGAIVSYVWMTASLLRGDLAVQASTDPLTGLLNRRAIDMAARRILGSMTLGQSVSAIAVDVNDFKSINDSFGHSCGDATLVAIARCLKQGLRDTDFVGRMGGDEFVALLPRTPVETATQIANKLESAIRKMKVPYGGTLVSVSASFGCAQAEGPGSDWGDLLTECDTMLYQAKNGQQRTPSWSSGEVEALQGLSLSAD
jgi:diguanylate cyclase (GGDEF)-like protein